MSSSDPPEAAESAESISHLIEQAAAVCIVVSDPVDPDCVGTGLALAWWLETRKKPSEIVSFTAIPEHMRDFPDIGRIRCVDEKTWSLPESGIAALVDGSSWSQFFGKNWEAVLKKIDLSRIVSIDHHEKNDIYESIPRCCLNVQAACTAQVLHDYFLACGPVQPPPHVADYLYLALLYDARMFKNEVHAGEYAFAEKLIELGADHGRAVDTNHEQCEFDFFAWAVPRTEYLPGLRMTMLELHAGRVEELKKMFGDDFAECASLYKEVFKRQVRGYDYGIMLRDNLDGTIRLNWRTRNYGTTLSIGDIARSAGFHAGGHRNAGGGLFRGTIADARERFLREMRAAMGQK